MSDMDLGVPPDLETPSPQLFMRRAADKRGKADAGMAALNQKRRATDEKYASERKPLEDDFIKSGDELAAMRPPTVEKMPDPNLGPLMDPKQATSFLYGMFTLSLIGAAASRDHWGNASAALDGALKGYVQGNMQVAGEKKAEFDREYKIAHEKQAEADRQYSDIIKSKTMSLNMKAARLKSLAAAHGDDVMRAAAEQKDYDMMYRLADQAEGRAAQMKQTYDKLKDKPPPKAAAAKAAAPPASPGEADPAVETMTWDFLIKNHNPPANGGKYNAVMANVKKIAADNGMTVQEIMSASADAKTKLQAKRSFEIRTQNITRAENQLEAEIPVMEEAMKALDQPSIPIAARGKIWVLRQMGDPSVTKLDQAAETVFKEFEGIVTGNPGTLNVQDVVAAHENYKAAQTPQQMKAAIEGMRRIIHNAKAANDKTRDEIMGGINKGLTTKPGGAGKAVPLDDYLKSQGF